MDWILNGKKVTDDELFRYFEQGNYKIANHYEDGYKKGLEILNKYAQLTYNKSNTSIQECELALEEVRKHRKKFGFVADFDKIDLGVGLPNNHSNHSIVHFFNERKELLKKGAVKLQEMEEELNFTIQKLKSTQQLLNNKINPNFSLIDNILRLGLEMEKFPESYLKNGENDFRNNFITHLNAFNENFVSGETFNKYGKTDILVTNNNKEIEFIAECKLWTGKGQIIPTIEQLFNRYVGWRNNQVAIIIFNKSVGSFTDILEKARNELKSHPLFLEFVEVRKEDCSYSYIFKHPDDDKRKINTELIVFNFYGNKN